MTEGTRESGGHDGRKEQIGLVIARIVRSLADPEHADDPEIMSRDLRDIGLDSLQRFQLRSAVLKEIRVVLDVPRLFAAEKPYQIVDLVANERPPQ
jgi:acyl carrier protein